MRVTLYLHELLPPRFATLGVSDNHLVARYEWPVPDLQDKIQQVREGRVPYIDSEKFYISNNGYRMMLRLYPEKAAGFVGLYAVLTKGAYDDELLWPFSHTYRLEVISKEGKTIGRTTYPGTPGSGCPDIAFQKPDRELAEWSCGEGHMVAHDTLFKGGFSDEKGGVRFGVTVFLQELMTTVASIGFERGVFVSKYSWIVKDVASSIELLRTREKSRIESPIFYSDNQGYAMRMSISLGRLPNYRNSVVVTEKEENQVIGLYWTLHAGLHDEIVTWPFSSTIALVLVDRTRQGQNLEKIIDPVHSKCPQQAFERPTGAHNEHSCGFSALVTLQTLMSAYVYGDILHIKVNIVHS